MTANMDGPQLPQDSSIPQFLLDTGHPWLIKHQSLLERLPDVESFLYSPPGTKYNTPASQRELDPDLHHHLEVPADLFSTLHIDNEKGPTLRAGWPSTRHCLLELQRCPAAALARVRSLEVRVWVYSGALASREELDAEEWQDLEGPAGDELLGLFASALAAMTGLERLRWEVLPEYARRFREGLVSGRGLLLPSVSKLNVAPFCEYMVDACPNVEVLEGGPLMWNVGQRDERYPELLAEAAAKLPKVREFSGVAGRGLTPSYISGESRSFSALYHVGC